jgi:hypothetical protein
VTTVFAADRASRFHATADCGAFQRGQYLNDWDCGCDWGCGHRTPRLWALVERPLSEVIALGKMPCWACYRGKLVLPPPTEDFGHRPVNPYAGTKYADQLTPVVCARCVLWGPADKGTGFRFGTSVLWPCTSAVVLGLVPLGAT